MCGPVQNKAQAHCYGRPYSGSRPSQPGAPRGSAHRGAIGDVIQTDLLHGARVTRRAATSPSGARVARSRRTPARGRRARSSPRRARRLRARAARPRCTARSPSRAACSGTPRSAPRRTRRAPPAHEQRRERVELVVRVAAARRRGRAVARRAAGAHGYTLGRADDTRVRRSSSACARAPRSTSARRSAPAKGAAVGAEPAAAPSAASAAQPSEQFARCDVEAPVRRRSRHDGSAARGRAADREGSSAGREQGDEEQHGEASCSSLSEDRRPGRQDLFAGSSGHLARLIFSLRARRSFDTTGLLDPCEQDGHFDDQSGRKGRRQPPS